MLFHPSIDRGVAFALFLKYNSGEEMIERWLLGKVDIQDLPKDNLDKHCFEEYIKGWLIVKVDSAAVSIFVDVLVELTSTVFVYKY